MARTRAVGGGAEKGKRGWKREGGAAGGKGRDIEGPLMRVKKAQHNTEVSLCI